jgi:hypothetical protein
MKLGALKSKMNKSYEVPQNLNMTSYGSIFLVNCHLKEFTICTVEIFVARKRRL